MRYLLSLLLLLATAIVALTSPTYAVSITAGATGEYTGTRTDRIKLTFADGTTGTIAITLPQNTPASEKAEAIVDAYNNTRPPGTPEATKNGAKVTFPARVTDVDPTENNTKQKWDFAAVVPEQGRIHFAFEPSGITERGWYRLSNLGLVLRSA